MEVITRKDAAAQGRKRFFTGKACSKGHVAQRFVSTGGCCACNKERATEFSKQASMGDARTFSYSLHPDDHAAALSYCQALDLTRGRVPGTPIVAGPVAALSPDMEALRQQAQGYGVAMMQRKRPDER